MIITCTDHAFFDNVVFLLCRLFPQLLGCIDVRVSHAVRRDLHAVLWEEQKIQSLENYTSGEITNCWMASSKARCAMYYSASSWELTKGLNFLQDLLY